jgi:hypothetical protein
MQTDVRGERKTTHPDIASGSMTATIYSVTSSLDRMANCVGIRIGLRESRKVSMSSVEREAFATTDRTV